MQLRAANLGHVYYPMKQIHSKSALFIGTLPDYRSTKYLQEANWHKLYIYTNCPLFMKKKSA